MEERTLRVLDFHPFLDALKTYASSDVGRNRCLSLRPEIEKEEVAHLLREFEEITAIRSAIGDFPLDGLYEIRPLLAQTHVEGAILLPEDLLKIKNTLNCAVRVRKFLIFAGEQYPQAHVWAAALVEFTDLVRALGSTLGPRGEILDSASQELRHIRKEISRLRNKIRDDLEALWKEESFKRIFQEQIITLRNERYVVSVKAEFKNSLPGIIHDQSQSKATFFIEPFTTVGENNELHLLLKDEKEEELRILRALTSRMGEQSSEIAAAVEILGKLDLLCAKAKYAKDLQGTIPSLSDEGIFQLPSARHPLLDSQEIIPIDLHLNAGQSTLIVTGANAGGKTVALKTLGLLTLMAQCGMAIPAAEGSTVSVYRKIFADIGDEQSLKDHLSTFSAWILSLSKILREADASSLVLLDEVGGGTDPVEGAALAMALIDELRAKGAKIIVTTHLQILKGYGAIHADAVNVSVGFDPETLRPNYRLIYGRPGESYALPMAEKWGLPPEVIQRAKRYLGEGDRQMGELLQRLEKIRVAMEAELEKYQRLKEGAELAQKQAEALLAQAHLEEEKILEQAREEAQASVRHAKEELRKLINEFKAKGRSDVHRLAQAIRAEEERIAAFHRPVDMPNLPPGEGAAMPSQQKIASGFSSLEKMRTIPSPTTGKKRKGGKESASGSVHFEMRPAAPAIKVIGLRVEEALPLVDRAIDEGFMQGLREVEIIHGAGTGRLRQAVREHLREHAFVKSFSPGDIRHGGDGVTLVEIGLAPPAAMSSRRSGKNGWRKK